LLRTATNISGWYGDTWTGPTVDWLRHACRSGELRVPVRSDPLLYVGTPQRIAVTGTTKPFVVRLSPGERRTIVVPLQPAGGVCRVHFAISPARRPVDFPILGNGDSRTLGVLASGFQYVPAAE
jgi:hypothetical protein